MLVIRRFLVLAVIFMSASCSTIEGPYSLERIGSNLSDNIANRVTSALKFFGFDDKSSVNPEVLQEERNVRLTTDESPVILSSEEVLASVQPVLSSESHRATYSSISSSVAADSSLAEDLINKVQEKGLLSTELSGEYIVVKGQDALLKLLHKMDIIESTTTSDKAQSLVRSTVFAMMQGALLPDSLFVQQRGEMRIVYISEADCLVIQHEGRLKVLTSDAASMVLLKFDNAQNSFIAFDPKGDFETFEVLFAAKDAWLSIINELS